MEKGTRWRGVGNTALGGGLELAGATVTFPSIYTTQRSLPGLGRGWEEVQHLFSPLKCLLVPRVAPGSRSRHTNTCW